MIVNLCPYVRSVQSSQELSFFISLVEKDDQYENKDENFVFIPASCRLMWAVDICRNRGQLHEMSADVFPG